MNYNKPGNVLNKNHFEVILYSHANANKKIIMNKKELPKCVTAENCLNFLMMGVSWKWRN